MLSSSSSVDDSYISSTSPVNIPETILKLEEQLNTSLKKLNFKKPIAHVYRPFEYAYKPHSVFTRKYCFSSKKLLFLGMNPSLRGTCQTGIPFGDVNIVKEWFKINEEVSKPENECHKTKVIGLSETSGQRFWGLFKKICTTPEVFFENAFVYNYCPIAMMEEDGQNVTPEDIKGKTRKKLEEICDRTLLSIIELLQPTIVIGVGKLAEVRALKVIKENKLFNIQVFYLKHPSSKIPNNHDWVKTAEDRLKELSLMSYFIFPFSQSQ